MSRSKSQLLVGTPPELPHMDSTKNLAGPDHHQNLTSVSSSGSPPKTFLVDSMSDFFFDVESTTLFATLEGLCSQARRLSNQAPPGHL